MYSFLWKFAEKYMNKMVGLAGSSSHVEVFERGRFSIHFHEYAPRGHEIRIGFAISNSDNREYSNGKDQTQ